MNLLFCLGDILSDFRHLFNQQNFALFQAFIFGFIANNGRGTLTELYQCSASETKYWSFPKFLSRGQWNADAVAALLIRRIQRDFTSWVYVYDQTKAIKTGVSQWGLHFFRNFSYQKHRVNQSKFHYGHEFGALGLLCQTPTEWLLFPVYVKLIVPQTLRDKSFAVLRRKPYPDFDEYVKHRGDGRSTQYENQEYIKLFKCLGVQCPACLRLE